MIQHVPEPTVTDERTAVELVELMAVLRRGLRRAVTEPWPGQNLTGAQFELLRLLRDHPGLSVNEAAETLQLAPNTVSALVGQLVDKRLVRRARDKRDGRVARLELSAQARRHLEARLDERVGALRGAIERLDEDDRRALEAAFSPLYRIIALLDE